MMMMMMMMMMMGPSNNINQTSAWGSMEIGYGGRINLRLNVVGTVEKTGKKIEKIPLGYNI